MTELGYTATADRAGALAWLDRHPNRPEPAAAETDAELPLFAASEQRGTR